MYNRIRRGRTVKNLKHLQLFFVYLSSAAVVVNSPLVVAVVFVVVPLFGVHRVDTLSIFYVTVR